MRNLVSTLPVQLSVEELWTGLRNKAENPVGYIPAITACSVLEKTEAGFVREITIADTVRQQERVTFEPKRRVVFEQLTDPDLETIINQISVDGQGVSLTLTIVLSPAGAERAEREPEFLSKTEAYFAGTLVTIVDELHRTATEQKTVTGKTGNKGDAAVGGGE
ncbi:AtaL-like protein [Kutzneria sp. NPDC051319]|uniref:AtaL-like protein n=1 Tax=Kutzneria sp. NPDC051319 TaxID=3155047 RepID=UPI003420B9F3